MWLQNPKLILTPIKVRINPLDIIYFIVFISPFRKPWVVTCDVHFLQSGDRRGIFDDLRQHHEL